MTNLPTYLPTYLSTYLPPRPVPTTHLLYLSGYISMSIRTSTLTYFNYKITLLHVYDFYIR